MGIILITLGIVMLSAQITGLPAVDLILKWWPVVLVMLGAEILIYIYLSKQEQPKVKFDVLSIIIITFIMIASVGTYTVTSVLQGLGGNTSLLSAFSVYKYESQFKKNMSVDLGDRDTLIINNSSGNIDVVKGDSDKIEIEANITIRNNDEDYAAEISEKLIEVTEKDSIKISSKSSQYTSNRGVIQSISINYYIKVPEKVKVEVDNKFGDVYVDGIALSVRINNEHGKIAANTIGSDLYINNSFGDVKAEEIKGKAEIFLKHGKMSVTNVQGSLDTENSFGDMEIRNIKGSARVTNSHGKIKASQVDGDLTIASKFCDIDLTDIAGSADVEGGNGDIDLKNVGKDVKVVNKFGYIHLTNASKKVDLTGGNGNITFETDRVIENNVRIDNKFGKISLKLPEEQQGYFNVKTKFGKIESDFGLSVNKEINEEAAEGTLGSDDIKFYIDNGNGDVIIEKF